MLRDSHQTRLCLSVRHRCLGRQTRIGKDGKVKTIVRAFLEDAEKTGERDEKAPAFAETPPDLPDARDEILSHLAGRVDTLGIRLSDLSRLRRR